MTQAQLEQDTEQKSSIIPVVQTKKKPNKIRYSDFEFEVIKGFESSWSHQRIIDHLRDVCHYTVCWETLEAYRKNYYEPAVKGGQDKGSLQIMKMVRSVEIDKYVAETAYTVTIKKADRLRSGILKTEITIKKLEENPNLYGIPALLGKHADAIEDLKDMQGELDALVNSNNSPESMKRVVKEQVSQKTLAVYHNFVRENFSQEKADEMFEAFLLEIKYI